MKKQCCAAGAQRHRRLKGWFLVLLLAASAWALAIPAGAVNVSDLDGKTAGVMNGTPQDQIVTSAVKDAKLLYYNSVADQILALREGKIDFFVNSSVSYMMMAQTYPDLYTTEDSLTTMDLGVIFPKTTAGAELKAEVDEYLAAIKEDGTLQEMIDYWVTPDKKEPPEIPMSGKNGTLLMATCSTMMPFSYISNGQPAGMDVALAAEFCRQYGYGLKIEDLDFAGVLTGVGSGKYDLAAGQISWTSERAESVLYSDAYYVQQLVAILVDKNAQDDAGGNIWGKISEGFRKTFVTEGRWKLIAAGLGNTIALTVVSVLCGSLLGYAVCLLRGSGRPAVRGAARVYIKLLQGTPILVLLLILYYVIFRSGRIPGFWVAAAAFAMNFAAYFAEILRSGISGIDKGQTEAALALGYTDRQAFYRYVLPQAAVRSMPVIKGQIVTLLKGTSVVGYIAVCDLTRAGDIIRSRTYEAFFPLIATAAIYFLLAWVLTWLLDRLEIGIDPRKRGRNEREEA